MLIWWKSFQPFMRPEGPLPCSQDPAIGLCLSW